jgi:hypothetical protein
MWQALDAKNNDWLVWLIQKATGVLIEKISLEIWSWLFNIFG